MIPAKDVEMQRGEMYCQDAEIAKLRSVVEAAKKLQQAVAMNDIRSTGWISYAELYNALAALDPKAGENK